MTSGGGSAGRAGDKIRRVLLAALAWDVHMAWLRWLIRRAENREPRWKFWWAYFMFQVLSGYPPGELHHWPESPKWLKNNPALEDALVSAAASKGDPGLERELREWWATDGWYVAGRS